MNKWQWAAAAGAAVLALGVGYFALSEPRRPADTDIAYNDPAYDAELEPATTGGASQFPALDAQPAAEPEAAPAAAPKASPARSSRPATPPDQPVIEQIVGVGPSGAAPQDAAYIEEEEPVVVEGRRTVRPQWVRTPSETRLSNAYPRQALDRGREGEARVACTILDTGRLDCARVSEFPEHAGFGSAAVRVAESFRHAPQLEDGRPAVGTPVNFRVLFRLEDPPRRRT